MIEASRRSLILGIGASLIAAPAIVRASSLMKVKPLPGDGLWKCSYRELPTKILVDPVYFLNSRGFYVYYGNAGPVEANWVTPGTPTSWENAG